MRKESKLRKQRVASWEENVQKVTPLFIAFKMLLRSDHFLFSWKHTL